MNLTTRYLGFDLANPFVPGASPLANDIDTARRLEDAGAPMLHLSSLFEEQVRAEQLATSEATMAGSEQFAEAMTYLPSHHDFQPGPEEYLDRLSRIKQSTAVPVVASLNGTSLGGWLDYARLMQQAGADAIELNLYRLTDDPTRSARDVEDQDVQIVREIKSSVTLPLAVKLSPFYTALPHVATRLVEAGADALVLFNRFYQADIDIEQLEAVRTIKLSDDNELLMRLRWVSVLYNKLDRPLALTGGVHTAEGAIKALMAGAQVVQLASSLLNFGPRFLETLRRDVTRWLDEHEYESLDQLRGSMSLERCPDPSAFLRANYVHILSNWGRV